MSYRSRAYSDATKYDHLGSPVSHRYQGYDVPDYSSTNRYRGEYPSDAPKEYTLHKSDRIYTSRSTHGGSDSHFDTRDEFQPSYISRRYYYDYSFDDDELYFSDHDHHRKHQSARSGTEAPIIINIFSDKSTSSGHSHQSKTTRSTKDRSERDILALPQSLQPVARQVDAEFSRLEKEAEDLEKEYARHKYDVKKYEDVKKRIAAQWQIYLGRHDEICQQRTKVERSHKSTHLSPNTYASGGRSSHGRSHTKTYNDFVSDGDSTRTKRPSSSNHGGTATEEPKTITRQSSTKDDRSRQEPSKHGRTTTEEPKTRTRQSSTKDDRHHQSYTHDEKSRTKTERSHKDGTSDKTGQSEKSGHHRDDKTKSSKSWWQSGSSSRPKEETKSSRSSTHDGERRKEKHGRETMPDIIEEVTLPDHYGTLGISSQATAAEIKKAAKLKRVETHPDKKKKSGMSSRELKTIDDAAAAAGQAADVLTDSQQKEVYDRAWAMAGMGHR